MKIYWRNNFYQGILCIKSKIILILFVKNTEAFVRQKDEILVK